MRNKKPQTLKQHLSSLLAQAELHSSIPVSSTFLYPRQCRGTRRLWSVWSGFSLLLISFSYFSSALVWVLHGLQFLSGKSAPAQLVCGLSHGLQGISALVPWSISFSSSSSDFGVPSDVSYSFCSLLSLCSIFCPFLNVFSQRCHQFGCWVQLCPAVGLMWSWLQLAVSGMGQPLTSLPTGATPVAFSCPTIKILLHTPSTCMLDILDLQPLEVP